MIFEQLRVGGDRNFAYLVGDRKGGRAIAVDPSFDPEMVLGRAAAHDLTVEAIACTHSHYDHTNGNDAVRAATGAEVWLFGTGAGPGERGLVDGETILVGELRIRVIHTPGHTPDAVCYLVGGKLLTGDTLFVGKVGGTGFGEDAREQYDGLHEKLLVLPDETEVWPGHDYGVRPSSTIGEERRSNPFLLQTDFESFLHLKKNWAEYKRDHGIA
ncbi:MAG: MBL fold metallo-hydrolase [Candidatus Eisenbacteria bacterium]|nr:MBL fold metallo-hydrolase [Candidatus Eisenbacteria bacterium]